MPLVTGTSQQVGVTAGNLPLAVQSADGAINPLVSSNYAVTKAGVCAMTLAAPTVDGVTITIFSTTANAHTLTATSLLQTGSANVSVATFAASAGGGVTLVSYNGKWVAVAQVAITFS